MQKHKKKQAICEHALAISMTGAATYAEIMKMFLNVNHVEGFLGEWDGSYFIRILAMTLPGLRNIKS